MTIFDLLFLASFLVSVIVLAAAAYAAIRGRVWLVCAAVYLGISVAVAYLAPQRVIAAGTSMTGA